MNILKQLMSDVPEKGWQWRTRVAPWPGALGSTPYEYQTRGFVGETVTRWRQAGYDWSPTLKDLVKDKFRDELRYLKQADDPMETAIWTLTLPFCILGQIIRFGFLGLCAFGFFWPLQQFGRLINAILDDMEKRQELELIQAQSKAGPGTRVSKESVLQELGDPATWEADRKALKAEQARVRDPRASDQELQKIVDEVAKEAITAEHRGHGSGDAESGPDDPDCPCRSTAKREECADHGCGFCLAERPGEICYLCNKEIPPGPFVKVSDDEVVRAHVECRPGGVIVEPDLIARCGDYPSCSSDCLCEDNRDSQALNPEKERLFREAGMGERLLSGLGGRSEPERIHSGECEICHQICIRDEMSYVDLKGSARFPDGSQQLQVCFSLKCRVKAEAERELAQVNATKVSVSSC